MEKNFILAFILIALVVLIFSSSQYQELIGIKKPKPEEATQTQEKQEAIPITEQQIKKKAKEVELEKIEVVKEDLTIEKQDFDKRDIIVSTALATITLTNEGGLIKGIALKEFNGPDREPPVFLTGEETRWLGTEIKIGDSILDLKNSEFVPDKYHLDCTGIEEASISFIAKIDENRSVIKTYTFKCQTYEFGLSVSLEGFDRDVKIGIIMQGGIVPTEEPKRQINIPPFSWLMRSRPYMYSKVVYLANGTKTMLSNRGKEKRITQNDGLQKVQISKETSVSERFSGTLNWAAMRNKYFLTAVIPDEKALWVMNITGIKNEVDGSPTYDIGIYKATMGRPLTLKVYAGPVDYAILKSYGNDLEEVMELSFRLIRPVSILFLKFLKWMRRFIPNYGFVIIMFSILLKVALHPITRKSTESMAKMQELKPQIDEIKKKYKGNPQKMNAETMKLYKEKGVNPLGGCLPALLPLPVFLALYPVIDRSIEMRQASFIPFWINDLSRPDPYFILPIIMGATMFIQNKKTMKDPSQKSMLYFMPIFMLVIFINFSAGLVLYWTVFSLIGFAQQMLLMKKRQSEGRN